MAISTDNHIFVSASKIPVQPAARPGPWRYNTQIFKKGSFGADVIPRGGKRRRDNIDPINTFFVLMKKLGMKKTTFLKSSLRFPMNHPRGRKGISLRYISQATLRLFMINIAIMATDPIMIAEMTIES